MPSSAVWGSVVGWPSRSRKPHSAGTVGALGLGPQHLAQRHRGQGAVVDDRPVGAAGEGEGDRVVAEQPGAGPEGGQVGHRRGGGHAHQAGLGGQVRVPGAAAPVVGVAQHPERHAGVARPWPPAARRSGWRPAGPARRRRRRPARWACPRRSRAGWSGWARPSRNQRRYHETRCTPWVSTPRRSAQSWLSAIGGGVGRRHAGGAVGGDGEGADGVGAELDRVRPCRAHSVTAVARRSANSSVEAVPPWSAVSVRPSA